MHLTGLKKLAISATRWLSGHKNPTSQSPTKPSSFPVATSLATPPIDYSRIDPSCLNRDGRETYQEIVSTIRSRLSFREYDFHLNRRITAPVVEKIFQGDAEALEFYKAHRLLHTDGIPRWAVNTITEDAHSARRTAFSAFDNYIRRMYPRATFTSSDPGCKHNPIDDLGLGQICSFKEAEEVLARASEVKRVLSPVDQNSATKATTGKYLLNDQTSFGTRACTSFANRASQMLIAMLLTDLAIELRPYFVLTEDTLLEILKANANVTHLLRDKRVTNIIYYAEFFKDNQAIPKEARQKFINENLEEYLHTLATQVEFYEYLPQRSTAVADPNVCLSTPTVEREYNGCTIPEGMPSNPSSLSNLTSQPSPLTQEECTVSGSDPLFMLLATRCLTANDKKTNPAELVKKVRKLIQQGVLSYSQVYSALSNSEESPVHIVTQLITTRPKVSPGSASEKKQGREVLFYTKLTGDRCPFKQWVDTLHEHDRKKIANRLETILSTGELGDSKKLTGYDDLFELRFGGKQGLRIYFSYSEDRPLLIWTGGHHDDQDRILRAINVWRPGKFETTAVLTA